MKRRRPRPDPYAEYHELRNRADRGGPLTDDDRARLAALGEALGVTRPPALEVAPAAPPAVPATAASAVAEVRQEVLALPEELTHALDEATGAADAALPVAGADAPQPSPTAAPAPLAGLLARLEAIAEAAEGAAPDATQAPGAAAPSILSHNLDPADRPVPSTAAPSILERPLAAVGLGPLAELAPPETPAPDVPQPPPPALAAPEPFAPLLLPDVPQSEPPAPALTDEQRKELRKQLGPEGAAEFERPAIAQGTLLPPTTAAAPAPVAPSVRPELPDVPSPGAGLPAPAWAFPPVGPAPGPLPGPPPPPGAPAAPAAAPDPLAGLAAAAGSGLPAPPWAFPSVGPAVAPLPTPPPVPGTAPPSEADGGWPAVAGVEGASAGTPPWWDQFRGEVVGAEREPSTPPWWDPFRGVVVPEGETARPPPGGAADAATHPAPPGLPPVLGPWEDLARLAEGEAEGEGEGGAPGGAETPALPGRRRSLGDWWKLFSRTPIGKGVLWGEEEEPAAGGGAGGDGGGGGGAALVPLLERIADAVERLVEIGEREEEGGGGDWGPARAGGFGESGGVDEDYTASSPSIDVLGQRRPGGGRDAGGRPKPKPRRDEEEGD